MEKNWGDTPSATLKLFTENKKHSKWEFKMGELNISNFIYIFFYCHAWF